MPVSVVIGAQWGDEGKGKIVDWLSKEVDVVARYQGGANAGHTICWEDQTFVLHLVPSGIFHSKVTCVIGNGVVIDLPALIEEIDLIKRMGYSVDGRFMISQLAHLIMPYHKQIEGARERRRSIGTTGRGIGPAYVDKFARTGIRMVDLLNKDVFYRKLREAIEEKNGWLKHVYGAEPVKEEQWVEEYMEYQDKIAPYIQDTSLYLNRVLSEGKEVLAEGAQGALLDVDFGTYPYVTSSHPTVGGCCTGLGIPPTAIQRVIGIAKAYTTRVGNGPFPTELGDERGAYLREKGQEYGATTGRPRRCGWLDLVALRYSAMINGFTELVLTKVDVLSGFDTLNVAVGYERAQETLPSFPPDAELLATVTPKYHALQGWEEDISSVTSFDDLPYPTQQYIRFIEQHVRVPVRMVSTGPKRLQTIVRPQASVPIA